MKALWPAGALTLMVLVATPQTVAQTPTEDSVGGTLSPGDGAVVSFDIAARSGLDGENPSGHVQLHGGGGLGPSWAGAVTCLRASGNVATIGFEGTHSDSGFVGPATGMVRIVDRRGRSSADTFAWVWNPPSPWYLPPGQPPPTPIPAPTDCSAFPGPFSAASVYTEPIPAGHLSVVDAPVTPPPALLGPTRRQLRSTLVNGIPLEISCHAFCRFRARLRLGGRQARELGLSKRRRHVVVARATGELSEAGTRVIRLTFSRRTINRLKEANRLRLKLDAKVQSVRGDSRLRRVVLLDTAAR